jgi:hypothetical protein
MVANLYHWRSNAFAQYGRGHIIVMANSVEGARKGARMRYERYLRHSEDGFEWNVLCDDGGDFIDAESKQEFIEKLAVFEADISQEPMLIDTGILFIHGSE